MIIISKNDQFYTEKSKILQALYQVIDPELFINIVDLGLVYDIVFSENNITIEMTLSTPHCPLGDAITFGVKNALSVYYPNHEITVQLVWEPKWTFEMMTDTGKKLLGIA
ncbi:MAG: DUF59 domain-containing protein [Sphingobacteriales bacterium]|uniref:metal-sulfur cluster assembly factor n=1 Tax=Hydrotalea flava TaxID=714549 RepID=UPI0008302084|nr:metal-sulfur cluster assembly factor [Hydrotalea flava]RTL53292.1 MAG: DUF59 domain-containing protein [Sphingobacteriales bacterium]